MGYHSLHTSQTWDLIPRKRTVGIRKTLPERRKSQQRCVRKVATIGIQDWFAGPLRSMWQSARNCLFEGHEAETLLYRLPSPLGQCYPWAFIPSLFGCIVVWPSGVLSALVQKGLGCMLEWDTEWAWVHTELWGWHPSGQENVTWGPQKTRQETKTLNAYWWYTGKMIKLFF